MGITAMCKEIADRVPRLDIERAFRKNTEGRDSLHLYTPDGSMLAELYISTHSGGNCSGKFPHWKIHLQKDHHKYFNCKRDLFDAIRLEYNELARRFKSGNPSAKQWVPVRNTQEEVGPAVAKVVTATNEELQLYGRPLTKMINN